MYVYGESTSNTGHSGHLSSRYSIHLRKHDDMVVSLTSCSSDQANGWFAFSQDGKSDHILPPSANKCTFSFFVNQTFINLIKILHKNSNIDGIKLLYY